MYIAKYWKIITKNGDVFAFTDSDINLIYEGLEYVAFSSHSAKNIKINSNVKNDSLSLSNMISSDIIKESDILNGKYDNADVEVFILKNNERISVLNGYIANIEFNNGIFTAQINGLKSKIDKTIGEVYSRLCRACFCDNKCKLNINFTNFIDCDKTFKSCCERGNAINFRGEPHLKYNTKNKK
jgi:uncharacterized phage protein (TIGR02218 family)